MTRSAPIIAGTLAALSLLFGAYMGAYYAMLDGVDRNVGYGEAFGPAYRVRADIMRISLSPAHQLDRLIRPEYWGDE